MENQTNLNSDFAELSIIEKLKAIERHDFPRDGVHKALLDAVNLIQSLQAKNNRQSQRWQNLYDENTKLQVENEKLRWILGPHYDQMKDLRERLTATEAEAEIDKLAKFIMSEIPGEPSQSESAVDCAIRLLKMSIQNRAAHVNPDT